MKELTMMQFRQQPGERIIDIIRDRTEFLITKQGKPVARLGPVDSDTITVNPDGTFFGGVPITFRQKSLGSFY